MIKTLPTKDLNLLNQKEFEELFDLALEPGFDKDQIRGFLLSLNFYDLPINAFIGAAASLKKRMIVLSNDFDAVDVCGTGGDNMNTLNISTAVAFVVAACGIKVAKHGNRAVSSKSGSADIFMQLGIPLLSEKEKIFASLDKHNLCFLFAPIFHPSLKELVEVRRSIAAPTIFNFLGPVLNPLMVDKQLIGTARRDMMRKIAAARSDAKMLYIVSGFDGMDEISLSDNSYLIKSSFGDASKEVVIDPVSFGINKAPKLALLGDGPEFNANKILQLFGGEKGPYRDIVILNAAFVLQMVGLVSNIESGILFVSEVIDSKKVIKNLSLMRN